MSTSQRSSNQFKQKLNHGIQWETYVQYCTVHIFSYKWVRKKIMTSTTLNPNFANGQSGKTW